MARIAGVNIPREKRVEIGLTYIYGVGRSSALSVCKALELDPDTKVRDLTEEEIAEIAMGSGPMTSRLATNFLFLRLDRSLEPTRLVSASLR